MPLDGDTLFLEPDLDNDRVNLGRILEAWDELRRNSVEVAVSQSQEASIWEFSANECVYFASINHYLLQKEASCSNSWAKKDAVAYSFKPVFTKEMPTSATLHPMPSNCNDLTSRYQDLWLQIVDHREPVAPDDSIFDDHSDPGMAPINEICSSAQKPSETIGVIYLIPSQFSGEVNLGLALVPSHRGKGLAREAVSILLQWVLDEACYHRVQVSLMAGPGRDSALKLFTGLGFAHEGTRRRQVFSPFSREYKDVTCMTILDTEWSIRHYLRHTPNNRWDELLQRHQREREELLEWEAARSKLKRTQSMETVRIPNEDIATENNMDCQQDSEMLEESEVFDLEVVQKDGTHTKQNQISNDWEDWRDYSPFLVSQTGNSPGASGSNVSERWSVEGNKPEGNEKHTGGWKSEGSSSPPPPSESSVSSWWEEISQASGSSGQWDQCETSSVAESV